MKKIVISLSIIAGVAAIVVGATTAFFSDTETSVGNTFTAGAIDLTVDSTCHYWQNNGNGYVDVGCTENDLENGYQNGNWSATNLGAHKFFKFSDIKPGDKGEDTISLHVDNNDAWLRLVITGVTDSDNTLTEPEDADVDEVDDLASGELRENLKFSMWLDQGVTPGFGPVGQVADVGEGDNIFNDGDLPIISSGTIDAGGEIWDLSLFPAYSYLKGGDTAYFGVAWELPLATGNEVQTDSMSATMEFQVQQVRNNPNPVW